MARPQWIGKWFETSKDWKVIQKSYKVAFRNFSGVPDRLRLLEQMSRRFKLKSFHNIPEEYSYLRNMALAGKIQAINGDLKGTVTMNEIAQSAKKIGISINILYTSNAEEYFLFPKNYRDNILRLPTGDKSTMVRTFTTGAKSFGFPEGTVSRYISLPLQPPTLAKLQKVDALSQQIQCFWPHAQENKAHQRFVHPKGKPRRNRFEKVRRYQQICKVKDY